MFHIVLSLPWLVVVCRWLLPLPWILPFKIIVTGVLLIASQHLLINSLSSGSIFAPEYPRTIILLFNALFGAMLLLAALQLALDAISVAIIPFTGSFPSVPPEVRYTLGIIAAGLATWGGTQAIRLPPVKNMEIAIADLPAAFNGSDPTVNRST